jgi:hypothetical protein
LEKPWEEVRGEDDEVSVVVGDGVYAGGASIAVSEECWV